MLSTLKVDEVSGVNGMHFICIEVCDTRREGWKYFRRVCWRGSIGSGNDGCELRVVDSSDEDKEYDTDFFWADNSKQIVFSGTVRQIWIKESRQEDRRRANLTINCLVIRPIISEPFPRATMEMFWCLVNFHNGLRRTWSPRRCGRREWGLAFDAHCILQKLESEESQEEWSHLRAVN